VSAVITDQRMPTMAGTELLERVSRKSPSTVRIILTAYAGPTMRKPGMGRAVECVIAKPWDAEMLRRALRGFFPEHGRPDPLEGIFPDASDS
jgi:serine/threonine-protein kinase